MGDKKTIEELIQSAKQDIIQTNWFLSIGQDEKAINSIKEALKEISLAFTIVPRDPSVLDLFKEINNKFCERIDTIPLEKNGEKINFIKDILIYFIDLELREDPGLVFFDIFHKLNIRLRQLEQNNIPDVDLLRTSLISYFERVFSFLEKNSQLVGYREKINQWTLFRGLDFQKFSQQNLGENEAAYFYLIRHSLADFKTYWRYVDEDKRKKVYILIKKTCYTLAKLSKSDQERADFFQTCLDCLDEFNLQAELPLSYWENFYEINFNFLKLKLDKKVQIDRQEKCFKSIQKISNFNLENNSEIEKKVIDFVCKSCLEMIPFDGVRSLNILMFSLDKCNNNLKNNDFFYVFSRFLDVFNKLKVAEVRSGFENKIDFLFKILFYFIEAVDKSKVTELVILWVFENFFNKFDDVLFGLISTKPDQLFLVMISIHNLSKRLSDEKLKHDWLVISNNYFLKEKNNNPSDKNRLLYYIDSGFHLSFPSSAEYRGKFLVEALKSLVKFYQGSTIYSDVEALGYYASLKWELAKKSELFSDSNDTLNLLVSVCKTFSVLEGKLPENLDVLNSCSQVHYECSFYVDSVEKKIILLRKSLGYLEKLLSKVSFGLPQIELFSNIQFNLIDLLFSENKTQEAVSQLNQFLESFFHFLMDAQGHAEVMVCLKPFIIKSNNYFRKALLLSSPGNDQCLINAKMFYQASFLTDDNQIKKHALTKAQNFFLQCRLDVNDKQILEDIEKKLEWLKVGCVLVKDGDVMIIENPAVLIGNSLLPPPSRGNVNNNNNNWEFCPN